MNKNKNAKIKNLIDTAVRMLKAINKSIRFSFKYAPLKVCVIIASEIVYAILPFVVLYNWQALLNTLTMQGLSSKVWGMVAFYLVIRVFELFIEAIKLYINQISCEIIDREIQGQILKKVNSLDIGKYDDPAFSDAMSVVDDSPSYIYITENFIDFAKSLLVLAATVIGIADVYPVPALAIVLFYIPTIVISCRNCIADYKLYRSADTDRRKSSYYRDVLTGQRYAQELRLYGFEDFLLKRYRDIWSKLYRAQMKLRQKQEVWELIGEAFNSLGFIVLIIYLARDMIKGSVMAGDVALYIGFAMTLMNSVWETGNAFSLLYRDYKQCEGRFEAFLNLKSALDESGTKIMPPMPEIEFCNVSFRYPGSDKYVLKNISFKIKRGEKLALVGLNGAGKTTLTKLLIRLYDPTEGEIMFNGVNAKEYEINSLRSKFAVSFQSSVRYCMSVKENITISDIGHKSEERFKRACKASDVDKMAQGLPQGYDTQMSKYFSEDGFEPSGGQRQKIGLARAYYRDADIIVLDEPSSVLDAEAEDYIFRLFNELYNDKSAVLITHRLSAVAMADKIAVIENGELIEFGTHDELMKKKGRYAELFSMQSKVYTEGL